MEISSSIALAGLQNAQDRFNTAASGVVRASSGSGDTVDLSQQAVNMLTAKSEFGASIRMVQVADEMQKTALNLLA